MAQLLQHTNPTVQEEKLYMVVNQLPKAIPLELITQLFKLETQPESSMVLSNKSQDPLQLLRLLLAENNSLRPMLQEPSTNPLMYNQFKHMKLTDNQLKLPQSNQLFKKQEYKPFNIVNHQKENGLRKSRLSHHQLSKSHKPRRNHQEAVLHGFGSCSVVFCSSL